MRHDVLSDVLSAIKNGDNVGKRFVLTPASNMVKEVLLLMQKHGYIGEFEFIDDKRGGKFKIKLLGKVNDFKQGVKLAAQVIDKGKAQDKFLKFKEFLEKNA